MSNGPLDGLIVAVTGATGTAGEAVCDALHSNGATLVLVGRDLTRLEAMGSRYEPRPTLLVADLADANATAGTFDTLVATHGRLDGVIHLVGGWSAGGVEGFDPAAAEQLWRKLVLTTANVAVSSRGPLLNTGGRFVAVSTNATDRPTPQNALYTSAKAAAHQWVSALAAAFEGTDAVAFTLSIDALLTPKMIERQPGKDRTGWTKVDQLANAVIRNWTMPHTNGMRILP